MFVMLVKLGFYLRQFYLRFTFLLRRSRYFSTWFFLPDSARKLSSSESAEIRICPIQNLLHRSKGSWIQQDLLQTQKRWKIIESSTTLGLSRESLRNYSGISHHPPVDLQGGSYQFFPTTPRFVSKDRSKALSWREKPFKGNLRISVTLRKLGIQF